MAKPIAPSSLYGIRLNGFCPNSPDFVVFLRDVLIGVVRQQRCRHNADDGTAEMLKRNRQTGSEGGEQRLVEMNGDGPPAMIEAS